METAVKAHGFRVLLFVAVMFAASQRMDAKCLKPIDGWRAFDFSSDLGHVTKFNGAWELTPAKTSVDGDADNERYKISVTNGMGNWTSYSYPGQPFMAGHFGKQPGCLVVMHVSNVTNGLGIVEWQMDILSVTSGSITLTASATLMDGGLESIFQGYGHDLGYLKTDWGVLPNKGAAGTWFSGQVFWLRNGVFERDAENFPDKFVRLYDKVNVERSKAFSKGVIGKPAKLLNIRRWWCS